MGHPLASKLLLPLFNYYAAMVQWYRNRNVSSPFFFFRLLAPEISSGMDLPIATIHRL